MRKLPSFVLTLALIAIITTTPMFGATVNLTPTIDTWVNQSDPDSSRGGEDIQVNAGTYVSVYNLFLKFDLTTIPNDSFISNASLYLYCFNLIRDPAMFFLDHVTADADVTNAMTWYNRPDSGLNLDSISILSDGNWVSWNLLANGNWDYTSDLTDSDNFISMKIWNNNLPGFTTGALAQFHSLENMEGSVYAPELIIEYNQVPIPPTILLLSAGIVGVFGCRKKFRT